jgi:hypothetical protein
VQIVLVSKIPKEELIFKAALNRLPTVMDLKRHLQDSRILKRYNPLVGNLYSAKIHILT